MDMIERFEFMSGNIKNTELQDAIEHYMPSIVEAMQFIALTADKHTEFESVDVDVHASGCDALQHTLRILEKLFNSTGTDSKTEGAMSVINMTVLFCGCTFGFLHTMLTGQLCRKHRAEFDIEDAPNSALLDTWIMKDYQHVVAERLRAHRKVFEPLDRIERGRRLFEEQDTLSKLLKNVDGLDVDFDSAEYD